jgi:hypothetical protein
MAKYIVTRNPTPKLGEGLRVVVEAPRKKVTTTPVPLEGLLTHELQGGRAENLIATNKLPDSQNFAERELARGLLCNNITSLTTVQFI